MTDESQTKTVEESDWKPSRPTPYEPALEAESMDDLDGIDIEQGDGCPHCGGRRDNLHTGPAGYYGCLTCGAQWAGDRENASLVDEPHSGPVHRPA